MVDYCGLHSLHPFACSWRMMLSRCNNPFNNRYKTYGARGITVCNDWHVFSNFYTDMFASWKPGLQIDRIDNDKGYSKENCRWATPAENSRNRTNSKLTQEQATFIREKNPRSMLDQAALAKQFGVSTRMIRYIRDGKAWQ